jgi:flagellar hook-associated protein 3 FlgL
VFTSRITQHAMSANALLGLQGNLARLSALQGKLASGKEISKPSDDPAGTVTALQMRSEIRTNAQYSRNSEDALGWLGTTDTALNDVLTQAHRVRDLTLQASSTGVADAQSMQAMSVEIDQLRSGMLQSANSTYLGRPVFGGTTTGTIAFDPSGTFQGDNNTVMRTMGPGDQVRADSNGPTVFGGPGNTVFSILGDISAHMKTDPTKLTADLAALDAATNNIQNAVSDVGARYNRVTQLRQTSDDKVLNLKSTLSTVEDIDLPRTITELQMQQVSYQAALGATAKVIQPSLIDFLK